MSKELWGIQKQFTERFFATKGGMPKTEKELTDTTKDYLLHLMKEVTEVLDQISFKMHRTPKEFVDRDNVLEEMIDCQKFLWGLMQVWGFSYEKFYEEFRRKSSVVEQRFAQERSMEELRDVPCVIVDIDGVLSDYPRCFYEWVSKHYVYTFERAIKEYNDAPPDKRKIMKREYRQSGAKLLLPVLPGAVEMLKCIHSHGVKIVLLTNRPYAEHFRIYPDTLEWLKTNNLEYDTILWSKDKGMDAVKNFKKILWAVDDQEYNMEKLQNAGVMCVKLNPDDTSSDTKYFSGFLRTLSKEQFKDAAFIWKYGRVI